MPANCSGAGRSGDELRRARRQQVRPGFAKAKFGLDLRQDRRGSSTGGRVPGEPMHRDLVPGAVAASRQQRGLASPSRRMQPGVGWRDPFPLLSGGERLSGGMVPLAATTHGRRPSRGESQRGAANPCRAKQHTWVLAGVRRGQRGCSPSRSRPGMRRAEEHALLPLRERPHEV